MMDRLDRALIAAARVAFVGACTTWFAGWAIKTYAKAFVAERLS